MASPLKQSKTCFICWSLLIPIPIVFLCAITLLMDRCIAVNFTATVHSNDTVKAGEFNPCHTLATLRTSTQPNFAIKAYSVNCNGLQIYPRTVAKSYSVYNRSDTRLPLYNRTSLPSCLVGRISTEVKLDISVAEKGRASLCRFSNYTHFKHFKSAKEERSNSEERGPTNYCKSFRVENHTTKTFTFKDFTSHLGLINADGLTIHTLHYNITLQGGYYNLSDYSNEKYCYLSKKSNCNVSLPFSRTCILIHKMLDEDKEDFYQLSLTGIHQPGKAKAIAAATLCSILLLYVLYLHIFMCVKYVQ